MGIICIMISYNNGYRVLSITSTVLKLLSFDLQVKSGRKRKFDCRKRLGGEHIIDMNRKIVNKRNRPAGRLRLKTLSFSLVGISCVYTVYNNINNTYNTNWWGTYLVEVQTSVDSRSTTVVAAAARRVRYSKMCGTRKSLYRVSGDGTTKSFPGRSGGRRWST